MWAARGSTRRTSLPPLCCLEQEQVFGNRCPCCQALSGCLCHKPLPFLPPAARCRLHNSPSFLHRQRPSPLRRGLLTNIKVAHLSAPLRGQADPLWGHPLRHPPHLALQHGRAGQAGTRHACVSERPLQAGGGLLRPGGAQRLHSHPHLPSHCLHAHLLSLFKGQLGIGRRPQRACSCCGGSRRPACQGRLHRAARQRCRPLTPARRATMLHLLRLRMLPCRLLRVHLSALLQLSAGQPPALACWLLLASRWRLAAGLLQARTPVCCQ